ncbi:DUF6678 family protein [Anaerosporobacter sp.]|uniref:DUF6678 family protein n=1 Tax=Anaerosporobacter sp. TaxID=1872529 RepID=UPI00286F75D2|nr:DUF6678 family protein [Anaerosporobacter sp.]
MDIYRKQREEMNMQEHFQFIYKEFTNSLNVYSGIIEPIKIPFAGEQFGKVFDVRWKGDIHFVVTMSKRILTPMWYYVIRDKQKISSSYCFSKVDKECILHMQHLIDDIERGRYNKKKTMKEQTRILVEKRGLTSYMNHTKWKELLHEINTNMKDIPLMYKTFLDDIEPRVFWSICGDEDINHIDPIIIEWMKFKPTYKEYEYQGRLMEPKTITIDIEEQLLSVLTEYNIPYEYDENEKTYIVFGYK